MKFVKAFFYSGWKNFRKHEPCLDNLRLINKGRISKRDNDSDLYDDDLIVEFINTRWYHEQPKNHKGTCQRNVRSPIRHGKPD
jgi:hypothetical protein